MGTAPIVTASSIVENSGLPGTRAFTFLEVGYSMLPVVILMALYFATFGYNLQQRILADLPDNPLDTLMSGETEQASTAVPVWKKAVALAAALFMIVGFAFNLFDIGAVSLMAAAIMLVCGVIPWKAALRDMDWNTVLVLAFSTPIGTACVTQTLVGGYRYHDFVKIGLPINILAILAVGLVSPIVYGL